MRKFRFDGYNGQGPMDFGNGVFTVGKSYYACNIDYYKDDDGTRKSSYPEPDASFWDDNNERWVENLCFFTEVFDEDDWLDTVSEPSPAELDAMNASAEELRLQFEG